MTSPCKAKDAEAESCELSNLHDICIHCGRTSRDLEHWEKMTHEEKRSEERRVGNECRSRWWTEH